MSFGPEVWVVLAVVVLLFGGSQLPKLARSLGEAKREFERGQTSSESKARKGEAPASAPDDEA